MDLLVKVDAAEAQGKHVILVNPQLKDIPSSGGVMGVRYVSSVQTTSSQLVEQQLVF